MARYRVRQGFHKDLQGREYVKGQIVLDDKPLHQLFPEKFDLIEEVQVPSFMAPPPAQTAANAQFQLADLSPQLHAPAAQPGTGGPAVPNPGASSLPSTSPAPAGPPDTSGFGKLANGDFSSLMGNSHYAVYAQKVGTGKHAKEGYTLVYADALEIPLNEDPLTRDKMDALITERLAASTNNTQHS